MAAAGCPVSGVGPDVAGVGLIFSLDFDSLHGRCALCRCSLIECATVLRSFWVCGCLGCVPAKAAALDVGIAEAPFALILVLRMPGGAYRRRLPHSLLVPRRLSSLAWIVNVLGGYVPAKATALLRRLSSLAWIVNVHGIGRGWRRRSHSTRRQPNEL